MASLKKNAFGGSDDEDELESLRLAALKSLKPKVNVLVKPRPQPQNLYKQPSSFGAAQTTRNHNINRGFRNNGGRRNGLNTRINPNLISIQVIDESETKEPINNVEPEEAPKLILPQDRYYKTQVIDVSPPKENSSNNKFDRYKNSSDESDSDSDSSPVKRERKNSFDALMDDIDNILEGKTPVQEEVEEEIKETNDTLIIEEDDPDIVKIMEQERHKSRSPPPAAPLAPRRSRSPIRKRVSPFNLNTEILNTITMAPLSPRSAAFVLENRQILARRQMSPRRSRSRSRSPRRRSRSPVRKCSLSPRKRSNSPKFSPKQRRSTSPRNYRTTANFKKQSVHKRLGTKTRPVKRKRNSRSISLSLSPSPDRNYHKRPLNETTGQLEKQEKQEDPILLARKKKFESPVQLGKNGVIKLKKNEQNDDSDDKSDQMEREVDSDVEIELNPNIDDLWSDDSEESDNENEGRFKSKTKSAPSVATISIRNLTDKPIPPKEPLIRTYSEKNRSKQKYESRRSKTTANKDRSSKVSRTDKIDDLKVDKSDDKLSSRRVKLNEPELLVLDCAQTDEPEIIIENDDDAPKDEESDLRAEICRRRAERLQKAGSISASLPTRLLKSALQEVVQKPSNQSKGCANAADRKVLIIKSVASSSPVRKASNKVLSKKEGVKLPIHMRLGQTNSSETLSIVTAVSSTEDSERRSKKCRPNKRKNRKVVQVPYNWFSSTSFFLYIFFSSFDYI